MPNKKIIMESPFLTAHEAAKYLNLSYTYFCQMCREKKIRHYKAGGKILIKMNDIEEYLESIAVNPEPKINIRAYYNGKYKTSDKYNVDDVKAYLKIKD
ncbi:MAG: excisionase family DNA-binding protein [bacterium]